jgi:YggT family protein
MFVLSNFLIALATILGMALTIYMWIIIARAIISWVNPDPYNPIVRFLYNVTEPVLYRVRRTIPFSYAGGIDFSPLIVLLGIYFLQIFLVRSLQDFALTLR